ncbi:hypothetical protein [Alkalihalobacterium sp. APHAB7]|uniref:hypothetical protein n=1 Tax=Alkalihalobacterium sp. APHAB7 TaxID=3402081 RepID=UPI003AAAF48A
MISNLMFPPRQPLVRRPKHTLAAFDKRQRRQQRNQPSAPEKEGKQATTYTAKVDFNNYGLKPLRQESSYFDVRV